MDINDNLAVLGTAFKASDGLFYIPASESWDTKNPKDSKRIPRAMMAVVRGHVSEEGSDNEEVVLSSDEDDDSPSRNMSSDDESNISSAYTDSDSDSDSFIDLDTFSCEDSDLVLDAQQIIEKGDPVGKDSSKAYVGDALLWHRRLGHAGTTSQIRNMMKEGIFPVAKVEESKCDPCVKGKFKRSYRGCLTDANFPGHLHADLVGKIWPKSIEGYQYFMTVVDEHSRYIDVSALRTKSEASQRLLHLVKWFERQSNHAVRSFHSDGGTEFLKARTEFEKEGIEVTTSTPYTPASNGLVERTQGVILSLARTCLVQAEIPLTFWWHALQHVVQCKNAVPHTSTEKIPYMSLFKQVPPFVKYLRPFGCRVLVSPVRKSSPKFHSRLLDGINLGHVGGGLYKVQNAGRIFTSKHARFDEKRFPGLSTRATSPSSHNNDRVVEISDDEMLDSTYTSYESNDEIENDTNAPEPAYPGTLVTQEELTHVPPGPSTHGEESTANGQGENATGASHGYNLRSRTHMALPGEISTTDDPSVKVALDSPEAQYWKNAIEEEFQTIEDSGTYEVATEVSDRPIPSGVILRMKRDAEGRPARFKARLVARGNLQYVRDSSYASRYAPVACFDLVRVLLVLTASFGWSRHQVDVKGAFLYAPLPTKEQIWIRLPSIDGVDRANGQVVRLLKSLYGLREAPKLWYDTLAKFLKQLGFICLPCSECLFLIRRGNEKVLLLAYVDDLALFGDLNSIKWVKAKLKEKFKITDLGACNHFLGVSIHENSQSVMLTQKALIEKLLSDCKMNECKPSPTPLPLSHVLYEPRLELSEMQASEMQGVPYKEVLGSLLYLSTRTRPELATVVSMLGKFASSPAMRHWKAMKHVLRYLKGTKDFGLCIEKGSTAVLEAWSDADWARDQDKRRSRSGILLTIGRNPVMWTSKMQTSVAMSTSEAEFLALSECVRDTNWVRQVLNDVGVDVSKPTIVYQDNLGTIRWTDEVQGLRKVKHVGIRYQFVKQAVDERHVQVLYTPSESNRADSLTKILAGQSFEAHRSFLHVLPASPRGGVLV